MQFHSPEDSNISHCYINKAINALFYFVLVYLTHSSSLIFSSSFFSLSYWISIFKRVSKSMKSNRRFSAFCILTPVDCLQMKGTAAMIQSQTIYPQVSFLFMSY